MDQEGTGLDPAHPRRHYYMENGQYMVKETVRPATQSEINKLRSKMSDSEWKEFTGEGTHLATIERAA